jgi:hypothetical protein
MFAFKQIPSLPVKSKMASTEVMRHGGNVIVAVLLTEISTLLGKMGEEKSVW